MKSSVFGRLLVLIVVVGVLAACDGAVPVGSNSGTSPRIATPTLTNGVVATMYDYTLTGVGGSRPYRWSIAAGALPPGLELGESTSLTTAVRGTPTFPGSYSVTVRLTDGAGRVAERAYEISITAAPLAIAPHTLSSGDIGVSYTQSVTASGGVAPYTLTLSSGLLPPGLSFATTAAGATITGTPVTEGQFDFGITVTDANGRIASRDYSVRIFSEMSLIVPSIGVLVTGQLFQVMLSATGGDGSYTFFAQAMPAGMLLSTAGHLRFTPQAAGQYQVGVTVVDSRGRSASGQFNVTVHDPLQITTLSLVGGLVGTSYHQLVTASGGYPGGYQWSVTGLLPPGLTLQPGTPSAILSGTLTTVGLFNFTVTVEDTGNQTFSRVFSIQVVEVFSIVTATLPLGTEGQNYSASISSVGGAPGAFVWTVSEGQLPAGLLLSQGNASSILGGTPSVHGTFVFTVRVEDSLGVVATRQFSLLIAPAPAGEPLRIVVSDIYPYYELPTAVRGVSYSAEVRVVGGTGMGYQWRIINGALPNGLVASTTISSPVLQFSGITLDFYFQDIVLRLGVRDSSGVEVSKCAVLPVRSALGGTLIMVPLLPKATASVSYMGVLTGYGGTWAGYSFDVVSGSLPTGLSVTRSTVPYGLIEGTPASAGTFIFSVRITDSSGQSFTYPNLTIVVEATSNTITPMQTTGNVLLLAHPGFGSGSDPEYRWPHYWLLWVSSGSGTGYTWEILNGTLPLGLSLVSDGSPYAAVAGDLLSTNPYGDYTITVRITDSAGSSALLGVTVRLFPPAPPPGMGG